MSDRWMTLAHQAIALGAMQKPAELAPFLAEVAEPPPQVVLEIGTCLGGTLWALAQVAADHAVIVSVDLPLGPFSAGATVSTDILGQFLRSGQRGEFLRGDSHDEAIAVAVEQVLRAPIDLLLIDGDHCYDGVRQDFERYAPLVRAGGRIAFHDILHHDRIPSCQVDRLWGEIRPRFDHVEYTDPGHDAGFGPWGGIGVITWPGA